MLANKLKCVVSVHGTDGRVLAEGTCDVVFVLESKSFDVTQGGQPVFAYVIGQDDGWHLNIKVPLSAYTGPVRKDDTLTLHG